MPSIGVLTEVDSPKYREQKEELAAKLVTTNNARLGRHRVSIKDADGPARAQRPYEQLKCC